MKVVGKRTVVNRLARFFFILSVLLLGSACSVSAESVDFTLPDIQGKQRSLSEFRGKWVLVNYWATWCPPCLEEMPELEIFHTGHKDKDAVVVGINLEQIDPARLKSFVEEQFISYPILLDRPRPRTELGSIPGMPTSFLVSPEGKVVARQVGRLTATMIESFIEQHSGSTAGGGK
jgi:peroxiredoxin